MSESVGQRWRRVARDRWESLKREHGTPARLGVAVGVGVFLGCSPAVGLQTLLALGAAWLFRLNKLAVLAGTQISFPPVMPLIIFVEFQLGERLLHGRWLPLSIREIRALAGGSLSRTLLLDFVSGSLLVGVWLSLIIGALTAWVVRRARARTDVAAGDADGIVT